MMVPNKYTELELRIDLKEKEGDVEVLKCAVCVDSEYPEHTVRSRNSRREMKPHRKPAKTFK